MALAKSLPPLKSVITMPLLPNVESSSPSVVNRNNAKLKFVKSAFEFEPAAMMRPSDVSTSAEIAFCPPRSSNALPS